MANLPGIGTLWIGGELSWLEQLCLQSFLDAGHKVTLFVYDDVKGVPDGVKIADANTHLPASDFIRHARTGSPAYHADVFRLRMIRDTKLIWADTDAYCLRPFRVPHSGHLHGWISDADAEQINNGVLRLPKNSKTLKAMLDFTSDEYPIPPWLPAEKREELARRKAEGRGVHVSLLPWGVWGPNALTWFLQETGEARHAQPPHVLYPVPFSHKQALLRPGRRHKVESWVKKDTLSIHFWGRRFRAAASRWGGVPPEGSYVADLLKKHGINPKPTAHLMQPVRPSTPGMPKVEETDTSMLDDHDIANLALQRSSGLSNQGAVRAWMNGDPAPLLEEARTRRAAIIRTAFEELWQSFVRIRDALAPMKPGRVADIGSGYAFLDLFLYRAFECNLVLIDIEESENRHFGFAEEGAGYASLAKARAFLEANGVPADRITTINPRKEPLEKAGAVDLAISLISCGFHYPARSYDAFFREQVKPDGLIALDIRKGSGGIPYLKQFGRTRILDKGKKHALVLVDKAAV